MPTTSASLRERIAAAAEREDAALAADGGSLLPPVITGEKKLGGWTSLRTDDPSTPSKVPLPQARKPARPRKHNPGSVQNTSGRLGVDIFALWEKAGRINTPLSAYTAGRDIMREADNGGGFVAGSTLRSTIVGPCQLSLTPRAQSKKSRSLQIPTAFEGTWISREDHEIRGRIEGSYMIWDEDHFRTCFRVIKCNALAGSGDVIIMTIDGEKHSGVLSEDGHILRWRDGDRWQRIDESFGRMQAYCEETSGCPQDIEFQGWSTFDRCVMSAQLKTLSRPDTGSSILTRPGARPGSQHQSARRALCGSESVSPERTRPYTAR